MSEQRRVFRVISVIVGVSFVLLIIFLVRMSFLILMNPDDYIQLFSGFL